MWYRIELNKDGSIASCEQVEGSLKGGRYVRFFEADSSAGAVAMAALWWHQRTTTSARHARRRADMKAKGVCTTCMVNPAAVDLTECPECIAEKKRLREERAERRKRGDYTDRRFDGTRDAAEKYADFLARRRADAQGQRRMRMIRCRLDVLCAALLRLSRSPATLREWLEGEIAQLNREVKAVAETRRARRLTEQTSHSARAPARRLKAA